MKKFRGRSSTEALAKVKKELGPAALIVETKRLADGLFEVTAALDREDFGRTTASPGARPELDAPRIIEEMREIKELLFSITGKRGDEAEAYRALKRQMTANGHDMALTLKLLASASQKSSEKSRKVGVQSTNLRALVRGEIGGKIRVKDPMSDSRIISFIGPTGAGKTTTIAKLAAVTALKKTKKVALLTMDNRRVGAPEQLLRYGRIIGVPVGVGATKADISAFIKTYSHYRFIFIDTPGTDMTSLDYIRELQGLKSVNPELKFNLVLSVRERDEYLYGCLRGFQTLPVDAITFTKLDGSSSFGQMLAVSARAGSPISYLGTGQKVPGDLMPATVKSLLDYLMPV